MISKCGLNGINATIHFVMIMMQCIRLKTRWKSISCASATNLVSKQVSACAIICHMATCSPRDIKRNDSYLFTPQYRYTYICGYLSCDSFRFIFMSSMKSASEWSRQAFIYIYIYVWFMADMWNRFCRMRQP